MATHSGRPRTGNLYRRSPTGPYYLRLQVNGKRVVHNLHTADKDKARERQAEILAAAPGRLQDDRKYLESLVRLGEMAKAQLDQATDMPLTDVWPQFLSSRRRRTPSKRMMDAYDGRCAAMVRDIGVCTVNEVTQTVAEKYVHSMEHKGIKGSTVDTHLQALRMIWATLFPGRENPWMGLRSAKKDPVKHYRRLSLDEIKRLKATAEGDYRTLMILGYTTGLRLIDAALLDWSQVDLKAGYLTVEPRKTGRKSHNLVRPPILPDLRRHLGSIYNKVLPKTGPVMPAVNKDYQKKQIGKRLTALFRAAGVEGSFHCFRVTYQSMADDAAVSRVVTRAVLGHSSSAMSDTYSRLDEDRAREALERAIRPLDA